MAGFKKILIGTGLVLTSIHSTWASQTSVDEALKAGKLDAAVAAYKKLDGMATKSLEGQLLWARILLAQNDTEEAFELMEPLVEKNPNNADLQFRFGQSAMIMAQKASIFSKMGYAKDGVKAWEAALKLDPNHKDTLNGLIGFHRFAPGIAGGDIDKALEHAKHLKTIDGAAGVASLVGVYQSMDKKDLALKELNQGINDYPQSSRLLFIRAMKHIGDEEWNLAHKDLLDALASAQDEMEKSNALYQLGKVAVKSGENVKQAIEQVSQLMAIEGHRYQQWGNMRLAQLYFADGNVTKASATLKLVDDSDDDDLEDEVKRLKKKIKKASK